MASDCLCFSIQWLHLVASEFTFPPVRLSGKGNVIFGCDAPQLLLMMMMKDGGGESTGEE